MPPKPPPPREAWGSSAAAESAASAASEEDEEEYIAELHRLRAQQKAAEAQRTGARRWNRLTADGVSQA